MVVSSAGESRLELMVSAAWSRSRLRANASVLRRRPNPASSSWLIGPPPSPVLLVSLVSLLGLVGVVGLVGLVPWPRTRNGRLRLGLGLVLRCRPSASMRAVRRAVPPLPVPLRGAPAASFEASSPEAAVSRDSLLVRRGAVGRLRGGSGHRRSSTGTDVPAAVCRGCEPGWTPIEARATPVAVVADASSPSRARPGPAASASGARTSWTAGPTLSNRTNWRTDSSLRARPAASARQAAAIT